MDYQAKLDMQKALLLKFTQPLTDVFTKYFPKSKFCITKTPLGGGIYVYMTLGNKGEYENGIDFNDPVRCTGIVYPHSNGFEFDFKPCVHGLKTADFFRASRSEKIRVQILRGDETKIIKGFEKILIKLSAKIKELAEADEFLPLPFDPLSKVK